MPISRYLDRQSMSAEETNIGVLVEELISMSSLGECMCIFVQDCCSKAAARLRSMPLAIAVP